MVRPGERKWETIETRKCIVQNTYGHIQHDHYNLNALDTQHVKVILRLHHETNRRQLRAIKLDGALPACTRAVCMSLAKYTFQQFKTLSNLSLKP